jgi:Uma2 family endonuclease
LSVIIRSQPATLDDLYRVEGKAELIGGKIVHPMASGYLPSETAAEIYVALREHVKQTGVGKAFPDGIGYAQRPPLSSTRESFSPDASYYTGPLPANPMRFIDGAPDFAVEVRSEDDYGPGAEADMAAKRGDYFEAGTKVVWDVDSEGEVIHCFRSDQPANPSVYSHGDVADAEPAVPGWRLAVDDLFGPAK